MRTRMIVPVLLMLAGTAYAAVHKSNEYHKKTFGRQALVRAGGSAGVSHVRNAPHEWGRGGTGFAKRVGSSLGEHAVKNTIAYGVAGLRHEDLKYHRSGKHGFGPRLKTALASTVVTRKTTTGKHTVASGRLAGNVGSGMISRAWQP